MTPHQKRLARHALGLPNARHRSYRNRYVAANAPTSERIAWDALADAGLAGYAKPYRGHVRFWLTEHGARLALEPGETLCPEDFPQSTGAADADA